MTELHGWHIAKLRLGKVTRWAAGYTSGHAIRCADQQDANCRCGSAKCNAFGAPDCIQKSPRPEMTPPPNNSRAKLASAIGITEMLTKRPLFIQIFYQLPCWPDAMALALTWSRCRALPFRLSRPEFALWRTQQLPANKRLSSELERGSPKKQSSKGVSRSTKCTHFGISADDRLSGGRRPEHQTLGPGEKNERKRFEPYGCRIARQISINAADINRDAMILMLPLVSSSASHTRWGLRPTFMQCDFRLRLQEKWRRLQQIMSQLFGTMIRRRVDGLSC